MSEVSIIHRYPQATHLSLAIGGHGIAVLHALLQRASTCDGVLLASASLRQLGEDVPASKDTISRRIDQLTRVGIVERISEDVDRFSPTIYVLHLDGYGIELVA